MKSYKTDIPTDSLTQEYLPANYTDAFACEVTGAQKLSADDMMISFWTVVPDWVDALFKVRNLLVRPFGLETGETDNYIEKFEEIIRAGKGSNGIMPVVAKSDNETVVLLSDKHLDAYMSVYTTSRDDSQTVVVLTLVHYKNIFGKVYFFFIRPFHTVIVKSILQNTLKRLLSCPT